MEDKSKLQKGVGQIKEGMGKISEVVGQIVETKFDGDSKPVAHAANVKKSEGITYIPKYKKFLAEFKASGQVYNAGQWDTEAQAIAAIATAKAHLYP